MSTLPTYYSLSKILNRVKTIIDTNVAGKYFWLKVEIANINFHRSGHIYLELAENRNGNIIAKCKAMIWRSNVAQIREALGGDFNNILKKGNEIFCCTNIQFDTTYGLSVLITNLSLEFAVGQIEKKRQETIDRLKKEGLIDLNKQIQAPPVISSIALIASENTSGYQDFVKNIKDNQYGYKYKLEVFSSAVQGNGAEEEILDKLITANRKKFDCIVKQVSQMQSAVFSGIGHETDITVIDFAANQAFKTPTEVSNYIINKSFKFEQKINSTYDLVFEKYSKLLDGKTSSLKLVTEGIVNASNGFTRLRRGSLHTLVNRLVSGASTLINNENKNLSLITQEQLQQGKRSINYHVELINKRTEMLALLVENVINKKRDYLNNALILVSSNSPKAIIKKGFSIPRVQGNLYKGEKLEKETIIELEFKDSTVVTKYIKIKENGR